MKTKKLLLALLSTAFIVSALELFFYFNETAAFFQPPQPLPLKLEIDPRLQKLLTSPRFSYLKKIPQLPASSRFQSDHIEYIVSEERPAQQNYGGTFRKIAVDQDTKQTYLDFVYNFDQSDRRITASPKNLRAQFSLFTWGCSYAFGDGVNDEETLASDLQYALSNHHVYNLGTMGFSPASYVELFKLKKFKGFDGVEEKSGVSLYIFIDDHLERVLGSLSWVSRGPQHRFSPFFSSSPPEYRGSFISARPATTWLYLIMAKLRVVQFFRINPPVVSEEKLELFAELVAQLRDQALAFGHQNFYFVFYPRPYFYRDRLLPHLANNHIQVLDYSSLKLKDILKNGDRIAGDGHPTPLAHKFLADLVIEDLRLDKK